MKKRNHRESKRWIMQIIMVSMISAACMVGCGSSDYANSSEAAVESAAAADYIYDDYSMTEEAYEESMDEGAGSYDSAEKPEVQSNRKLITTMNLDVETTEFDTLMQNVERRVTEAGGYIESSNQWNGNYYNPEDHQTRNASLTIRIPAEKLDSFVDMLDQNSNITNKSKSVEDVTLSYVDLESHRNALRSEEERLLELMDQAETLEEILQIEDKLTDVRYQLESMESQLRTYDNQINYSTIYLSISEVERVSPAVPESTWDAIRSGFVENLYRVGSGLRDFAIGFVVSIPFIVVILVILAILGLICFLLVKLILKLSEPKAKKSKAKKQGQMVVTQNISQQNMQQGTEEKKNDTIL